MTEAEDLRSQQNQEGTRDVIERCCRMAGSAALCIAALGVAYFGLIYWLTQR